MKARIIGVVALLAALIGGLAFAAGGASPAAGTQPDDEGVHKVWVCHATAGEGELKNGYNLIEVDVASTTYEAHQAHATTDPKENPKFGTLYDYIDVDPNNLPGKCAPIPPETTAPPPPPPTTECSRNSEGCGTSTTTPTTAPPTTAPPTTVPPTTAPATTVPPPPPVVTTLPPPPPPPVTTVPASTLPPTL